jgi:multiple sugar transport system permease protein
VSDASSYDFTLIGKVDGVSFQGYIAAFQYRDFNTGMPILLIGFANTMITSVIPTVASLFLSALAAFAFAKIKFKFSKLFFDILIFTMMIPGTILIIPHYMMYESFGWIDTYAPLIVPGLWGGASMIFFIRQFMYSIPDSLIEQAKIDGLSWFGIFMRIILPLIVPALLAQGLLAFISRYNAYLGPYLYLQSENMFTLQLAVAGFKSAYAHNYPAIMSVAILTIVPILIIYTIFQKYFVEGIATTGMKL